MKKKQLFLITFVLICFSCNAQKNSANNLQIQELHHVKELLEQKIESQNKEIAHQKAFIEAHASKQYAWLKEYDSRTSYTQWGFGIFIGILTVIVAGVGILSGFTFFNAQKRLEKIEDQADNLAKEFKNRIEELKKATDNLQENISKKVETRLIEREEEQMIIDALGDDKKNSSPQIKELRSKFDELRKMKEEKDYLAFDWFMLANEEEDKGEKENYEKACEYNQKATDINPVFAAAYYNWGNALVKLKREEEAIQKYEKAIQIKPDLAEVYNNWGNALVKLKREEEAIQKHEKATQIKPDLAEAYYNWGNALVKLKREEEAIQKYEKAIQIKPDYAEAYHNWNIALNRLKVKEPKLYAEKAEEFKIVLQQNKNIPELRNNEHFQRVYNNYFPEKEEK